MAHRFGMLRRFRFNLPQRIAAALLATFLLQGFWLVSRQTLTDSDYQYARCGRETWEKPSPLAGYYTSCGNIHDGILAYRLAGLPLTLNLLLERGFDLFRSPENRVVLTSCCSCACRFSLPDACSADASGGSRGGSMAISAATPRSLSIASRLLC
jgi:hypothetical protein